MHENAIAQAYEFEIILAEIASRLVNVPPNQIDREIEAALGRVAEYVDADLATILHWNEPEKKTLTVSHEWCAPQVGGPYFRGSILSDYPWLCARLQQSEPFEISSLESWPAEATVERVTCERAGIESILWVPYEADGALEGFVAMDTFGRPGVWGSGMVNQLRLAGQVFANVIERQRADLELQRAHREIRALKDQLEAENVALREEIRTAKEGEEIVGRSHALREVLRQVAQVADTDSTVLLLGETGAGKGLIAREIHARSQRRDHALICVNCAALPPSLIESELFGHEKGAFTGAVDRKVGRVELAEGGTLFLDEIGDLPVDLQVKLLRVLQEREFERVGSSRTRSADLRVIAATNRNLDKLVREGAFRRDLYYRLSVFPIRVPPLRERYDDVPLLVWYFVRKLESRLGKKIEMFDPSGLDALTAYDWPGNVRELENMVERAMILSTNRALDLVSVLPRGESGTRRPSELRREPESGAGPPIVDSLEEMEKAHILRVLEECGWRVRGEGGAAERLALKRSTLQSRMKKHGIRRTHD